MISEEKLKIMTKLALYEKKESESIKASKYTKEDYVGLKMINTGILITLCYMACLMIIIICKVDYLMNHITEMDIWGLGRKAVVVYVACLLVYMLLAYIVYSVKYVGMEKSNKEYLENLKKLIKIYKIEEKEKKEIRSGGAKSDDEIIDY